MTNGTAITTKNVNQNGTSTTVDSALTVYEYKALENYEATIETGMRTFLEVGEALAAIQRGKLYRVKHTTFEAYVTDRWGWTKQRAYQYISSATVARELESTVSVPNERIARALVPLEDPKARLLAMNIAIATAPEGKLTSEWVESTVAVFQDAMGTEGLVDPGANTDWTAMNAAVTHEAHRRMIEKRQQLQAGKQKSIASFIVDGNSLKLISPGSSDEKIDDDEQYRIIVYKVLTVEAK